MTAVTRRSSGVTATIALMAAILLAGCCEDTTLVEEVEVEVPVECEDMGDFVEVFPTLGTLNYQGIWGSSENDIFVVGDRGRIAHFDGTEWRRMNSGTMMTLYTVWDSINLFIRQY